MIEDQVHQHPVRLPPDKNAHIDVTSKFEKYVQQLLHDNYFIIYFNFPRMHALNFFTWFIKIQFSWVFFRNEIENTFTCIYRCAKYPCYEHSHTRRIYISRYTMYTLWFTIINFLFDSDQCKEPLLSEKQICHRITSEDARSTTGSESTIVNTTIMGTSLGTGTTTVTVTGMGGGTGTNAWMDTVVGVDTVTDPNDKSGEQDRVDVPIFDEGTTDSGRLPDLVAQSKIYGVNEDEPLESYLAITIQVFIPFLIAGLGMVGAGLVLDLVQVWISSLRFRSI